ncbi:MAG: enoyl-CoA hydratase-related protein, partial [Myxococcota bacterium]|nr:enoyl-CoA hydratase-related protein [Myxococcota bacterium]
MTLELSNLLYEQEGPVVTVTVNRPEALNALNNQTMRELGLAVEAFNADEIASVMIITGAGSKA